MTSPTRQSQKGPERKEKKTSSRTSPGLQAKGRETTTLPTRFIPYDRSPPEVSDCEEWRKVFVVTNVADL